MNRNLQKLFEISNKPRRLVMGLMSGTSLDGLDIALCSFEGSGAATKVELLHFETIEYPDAFRKEIRTVFSKRMVDLEKLCLLHPQIALQHAAAVLACLKKWNVPATSVDLLASHGQTIYHAPQRSHQQAGYGNATLQIGDGDHLAMATGIITVSDFRQKHIAAGGEGAPLAVYGDQVLFGKKGEDRILLNIGGIANFTFLPGSPEDGNILCTDVGPGNTMMDTLVQENFAGEYFDKDAALASKGNVNEALLLVLKDDPFFDQPFPKTTGPELFNSSYLHNAMHKSDTLLLSLEDRVATLNRFTADMIATAIKACVPGKKGIPIFCSGGGMHNPLLMKNLEAQLPGYSFHDTMELGIDPDAKEAVLFAVLANECICGNAGEITPVSMGKISFPS